MGFTLPVITSRNVVLPAPLGPITALSSPVLKRDLIPLRLKTLETNCYITISNKLSFFISNIVVLAGFGLVSRNKSCIPNRINFLDHHFYPTNYTSGKTVTTNINKAPCTNIQPPGKNPCTILSPIHIKAPITALMFPPPTATQITISIETVLSFFVE